MLNASDLMIGAFWGPRRETAGACARLIIDVVASLQGHDSAFREMWYSRDSSREVRRPFVADSTDVRAALDRAQNRNPLDGVVLSHMGYALALDQGRNRLSQGRIGFSCGIDSPWLWNSVTVDPPDSMPSGAAGSTWLRQALLSIVATTAPDWARVDHARFVPAADAGDGSRPWAGWMLYLDVPVDVIPSLPDGVSVEIVGSGVLIETTREWFDPGRADHASAALQVTRRLRDAGLLLSPSETQVRT